MEHIPINKINCFDSVFSLIFIHYTPHKEMMWFGAIILLLAYDNIPAMNTNHILTFNEFKLNGDYILIAMEYDRRSICVGVPFAPIRSASSGYTWKTSGMLTTEYWKKEKNNNKWDRLMCLRSQYIGATWNDCKIEYYYNPMSSMRLCVGALW